MPSPVNTLSRSDGGGGAETNVSDADVSVCSITLKTENNIQDLFSNIRKVN